MATVYTIILVIIGLLLDYTLILCCSSLPRFEVEEIANALRDIFQCNLLNVPTEVLANRFVSLFRVQQKKQKLFINCLDKYKAVNKSSSCWQRTLNQTCPKRFEGNKYSTFMCAEHLLSRNVLNDIKFLKGKPFKKQQIASISKYKLCQQQIQEHVSKCILNAIKPCNEADIIAIKTVRVTMDTVEELIRRDPSIYVIHYLRDPRATVLSKKETSSSFWSLYGSSDVIKEAEILCDRMFKNVKLAARLESLYPGSFKTIFYEDLATNSNHTLYKIYEFIDQPVSQNVELWLKENTKSKKSYLQTSRVSSNIAKRWMDKLTYKNVMEINKHCHQLFKELGFPW